LAIIGRQSETHKFKFSYYGSTVECQTSSQFTGAVSIPTAQLGVQAAYSGCKGFGLNHSVNMNGCSYLLNIENSGPPYAGNLTISCPAGKAIEVTALYGSQVKCTTTVGAQTTNAGGLAFTNEPNSTVGLGISVSGLKYHQQAGEGTFPCTTGDYTNGTYTGKSILEG
jgi:hypothetical protein